MTRRTDGMRLALTLVLVCLACAQPETLEATTDLYLIEIGGEGEVAKPVNLTTRDGYDNQPRFLPDGRLLYVSRTDGRADLFELDLETRQARQLTTTTLENEYSPQPVPGSDRISMIRVERNGDYRLLTADRDGGNTRAVTDLVHDPIGYYAWIDERTVAVVVTVLPTELLLIDLERQRFQSIAKGVGRSIQTVPGRRSVSFVHLDTAEPWIKEYSLDAGESQLIAPLPGGEDHAWTPDGRLLAGRGSELLGLSPGMIPNWEPVADLSSSGIREISRITVAPGGKHLILVGEPGDP